MVAVARDTRTSSYMLEKALVSGLLSTGCSVYLLGIAPTPALAFTTREVGARYGVMITASHNPPEYNGIKVFNSFGEALGREEEEKVEELVYAKKVRRASWAELGRVNEQSISGYLDMLVEEGAELDGAKLVVDPANGAASAVAPEAFSRMGCKVFSVNAFFDGFFPGRKPEPDRHSLKYLEKVVFKWGADAAIAFDGDADRVAVIDECGRFVDPDRLLAAYAAYVCGGGVVVVPVDASMCIDRYVASRGGRVVRCPVGDVNVLREIRRAGAVFGGEPSGAWIHPDKNPCPDGILSAVRILKASISRGISISEFVADVPSYPIQRSKVRCSDELKPRVMERLKKALPEAIGPPKKVLELDGVWVKVEEGWVLVRPSGTEPILRITAEAVDAEACKSLLDRVRELVERAVVS